MGTLACKMCAAPLKIDEDGIFARCSYCGMTYTLPFEDETEEERVIRAEPVLERARMLLKDGKYEEAADRFERVLDITPADGEAYLGKGLAQLGVRTSAELRPIKRQAMKNYYIKKALIFCRGDMKSELYDALGLKAKTDWRNISLNQWRSEVMSIRKSFFREIRRLYSNNDKRYSEDVESINEKYSDESAKIEFQLEKIEKEIQDARDEMQKQVKVDNILRSDSLLRNLNKRKRELENELSAIDSRRNSDIINAAESFSAEKTKISGSDFLELTKKYEIPGCVHDANESIVDKVYDILLCEYEFLSLSEIMTRDLCRGQSERRVEAALKKLMFDKRIISRTIDDIECYAPGDMESIEIE